METVGAMMAAHAELGAWSIRPTASRMVASPQNPHKSGPTAASPQKPHGQSGTPRHNPARMLEWPQDPLLAFMQVKRLTGSQAG
jgi:hypothetical protein